MQNILAETANKPLTGRLLATTEFVADSDIAKKKLLDIGCGFGWFEKNVLQRNVAEIIGTEVSDQDLKAARKSVKDKRVSFTVSRIQLPMPDKTFDTVVSWEVLEHIETDAEVRLFSEVNRVLKPKGVFYLSTPYHHWLSNLMDPALWLIGHRHYTRSQINEYANKSGFKIEQFDVKGGFWSLLSVLMMYISKWLLRRSTVGQDYLEVKENSEYTRTNGIATIFVKMRKIKSL